MIQAEIYFPFVGYTLKTTAEKTSIFDLIGSIGGQMGNNSTQTCKQKRDTLIIAMLRCLGWN